MAPTCTTRETFLQDFAVPIEAAREFELGGVSANFASGHPKEWGHETKAIDFSLELKGYGDHIYRSYHSAVSPDMKLLAIGSSTGRILVYDIAAKELRQVLDGAGSLIFRPLGGNEETADISEEQADQKHGRPAYTIVSNVSDEASRGGREENKLILWDLDQHGRLLDEEEPIDSSSLAMKAINAIIPELTTNHEWTKDFVNSSTLHEEFSKALGRAASEHRRRHNTTIKNATLGHFGSTAFSRNGRLLLYHSQNRTTQHGMRELEKLPQVVIYDFDAGKEIHRLSGHTDAVMWSAISPDDQYVASVSWDGTLRMYQVSTGNLIWATEDSGGQSWSGAFSPDSKYIIWSSRSGQRIQVHNVDDGQKVSTFQEKLSNWCRCLTWHPTKPRVALCVGKHVYIWSPFDGPDGTTDQHFAMTDDEGWSHMADVQAVSWLDNGRLLSLQISEGTKLVYDTQSNTKELFRRPIGVDPAWVDYGFYGLFEQEGGCNYYLSVDGDGKVRYWRDSVPASPSWWEKETVATVPEKKTFPETGKYVKITKTLTKGTPRPNSEQEP